MQNSNSKKSLLAGEDIAFVVRIIRKNWLIVLSLILIFAGIGFFYTYKMVDIFAARTQIQLNNKETGYSQEINENIGFPWWYDYYNDYNDELNIVRSYDLVAKAIDKLDLNVSYFITGRLRTTEVYKGVPFKVLVANINSEMYEIPLYVRIANNKNAELKYSFNGKVFNYKLQFDEPFSNEHFKITIKKNYINELNAQQLSNINYFIKVHSKDQLVTHFQQAISADIPEKSTILQIMVKDESPERAVVFLDTLTKFYIENTVQTKLNISDRTLHYIDKQLEEVTDVLTNIEDDLENYKSSKAILDLSKEEQDFFQKLSAFDSESSSLKLKLGTLEALEKYIVENKDPVLLPPSIYVLQEDEFLKKSVNELYSLQITRINNLYSSNEGNMALEKLDDKMNRLKNNLLVYIGNARKAFLSAENRINKQIGNYETNVKTIPKKQRDILNIERRLQVNEKMYMYLLEKRANSIITKAGLVPETKVVETARNMGVVEPNKKQIILYFAAIGLLIGLIITFIRIVFLDRIESIEELKILTNRPIVGEIIYSKESVSSYLVVNSNPKAPITESFRAFRTNLDYLIHTSSKEGKVILITSYNPSEGKTFCSLNLAAILAKANKKVLLVEMDMHRPKVHKGLNTQQNIGMSAYLSGQCNLVEAIKKSHIENLDSIVCGVIPPNASELVLSNRVQELIAFAKEHYDYLILDTPPTGLITDAAVLMKYTDANIFVLNTNYPNKRSIENAEEIFRINNIDKVSYLLNGVSPKHTRRYKGAYGYLYGYGYSYVYGYSYANTYAQEDNLNTMPWYKKIFT